MFRGPSATAELMSGVSASGQELSTYDGFWISRCGLNKDGALAISHRNIMSALYLMQSCDQYDLLNTAAGEFLRRWALMIQTAVRRNPKAPNFDGLDAYLAYASMKAVASSPASSNVTLRKSKRAKRLS